MKKRIPYPDSWEDVDLSAFEAPPRQLDMFGLATPDDIEYNKHREAGYEVKSSKDAG
jgi:hypothetical protein